MGFQKLGFGILSCLRVKPPSVLISPLFVFFTPLFSHLPFCKASEDGGEGSRIYSRNVRHGVVRRFCLGFATSAEGKHFL